MSMKRSPRQNQPEPTPMRYRAPWLRDVPAEGYTPRRDTSEPTHVRDMQIKPGSWDPETRTLDVVWTTGARVRRYDAWTGEAWDEELSLDPQHVRLGRLNSGAPLLDSHWSYGTSSVIGVVVDGSARIENGVGTATVRLSAAPGDADITSKIADGIIRSVSVGYQIHSWMEVNPERERGETPVWRAVDWEPFEISAVGIPADAGAGFRSGAGRMEGPMKVRGKRGRRAEEEVEDTPCECAGEEGCECDSGEDSGEEAPVVKTDADARAQREAERRGAEAERARIAAIQFAARTLRMDPEGADVKKLIDEGVPLAKAQSRLFELAAEADDFPGGKPIRGHVRVEAGETETEKRSAGIANAILHRVGAGQLDDNGRQYRGLSLGEMARLHMARAGIVDSGASISEVATRLFQRSGGMHHSTDFAAILENVANKSLRAAYEEQERTFLPIGRKVLVKDFRPVSRVQLGEGSALTKKIEGAEITYGTIGEAKEVYQIATYAGGFQFTREALINDDLDAFSRLPALQAARVASMENLVAWTQVTSNPVMGDGVQLFHSDHGNLAASAAPSAVALNAARLLMRTQTGLDGAKIRVRPRFIITPEAQLGAWEQLYSPAYRPTTKDGAMTDALQRLEIISDPLLDDVSASNWYLCADPAQIDTLEYAYLQGAEGPQLHSEVEFGVGVKFQVLEDFGAKWIDWRSIVKNPYDGTSPGGD